jgi:pyruvate formate lyase activating enzyme
MECPYCERRCKLEEGQQGYCRTYVATNGKIVERYPNRYSSLGVSHIEAIPFFHFQPGSRTLSLGGAGCSFDCHYCSNAYAARSEPGPLLVHELSPEQVVAKAKQTGCHSISFGINEPTVALPTLLEVAHAARKAGIAMGALTNGYLQPDAAEEMGKAFAFVNVSLKAMGDEFYARYVGVPSADPVRRNIETLRRLTHLEVSTPIIEGLNDHEIPALSAFIASVDRDIPWHVFRLLPEYKMSGFDRPSVEATDAALEEARRRLSFVYFGNFVGSRWVSTVCPGCGTTVVERTNVAGCVAKPRSYHVIDGRCASCGRALPIAGGVVGWNSLDLVRA